MNWVPSIGRVDTGAISIEHLFENLIASGSEVENLIASGSGGMLSHSSEETCLSLNASLLWL